MLGDLRLSLPIRKQCFFAELAVVTHDEQSADENH